jgi:type VI protein secretion system component Hcp
MLRTVILATLCSTLTAVAAPTVHGQEPDDIVLLIPNVEGESTVAGFEDTIPVNSWSYDLAVSEGGDVFRSLVLEVDPDKSLTRLVEACLKGTQIKNMRVISLADGLSKPMLAAGFQDAVIRSYDLSYSKDDGDLDSFLTVEVGSEVFDVPPPKFFSPSGGGGGRVSPGGGVKGVALLKIPHLKGTSTLQGHEGKSELRSFHFGVANSGGTAVLQSAFVELELQPFLDDTVVMALEGQILKEMRVDVVSVGSENPFVPLTILLKGVRVTGVSLQVADDHPVSHGLQLEVSNAVEWEFTTQDSDGTGEDTVKLAFDLKTGKVTH